MTFKKVFDTTTILIKVLLITTLLMTLRMQHDYGRKRFYNIGPGWETRKILT
jgi:hypothetical protein